MSRRDHECDDGTQPWSLSYSRFGSSRRSTGSEPMEAAELLPDHYGDAEVFHDREKCACCDISAGRLSGLLWHIHRLRSDRNRLRAEVEALELEISK